MKKLIAISSLALLAFSLGSCSLDDEPIGANITPASESFQIINEVEVNTKDVDFTSEAITLKASFNEQVTYTATFIGLESGAVKVITGLAKDIVASDLAWNGEHDGLFFFREGEKVKVVLSFVGTKTTSVDTLTVATTNDFDSDLTYTFKESGFEDLSAANAYGNGWFVGNDEVNEDVEGGAFDVTRIAVSDPVPPQGLKSFKISGRNNESTYVSGIEFTFRSNDKFFELPSNADEVWYNIYVYGNSNPHSQLSVEFAEADSAGLDVAYRKVVRGKTDGVIAAIPTNFSGWKLFSFKYSTLPFSTYAPGGGSGNKVHESNRIQYMLIGLEAIEGSTGEFVEAIFDYPIFTIGGPFVPSVHKSKP